MARESPSCDEEILSAATAAFRDADPRGLIAIGAPDDEYDYEARLLAEALGNSFDERKAAKLARQILEKTFEEPFAPEEGEEVAHLMAERLRFYIGC